MGDVLNRARLMDTLPKKLFYFLTITSFNQYLLNFPFYSQKKSISKGMCFFRFEYQYPTK